MQQQTGYEPIYRIPIVDALNGLVRGVGHVMAWANVLLMVVILTQVTLRYGFNQGMVALEELIWHVYAVAMMFGLAYAVTNDTHIRVDLIHMHLSPKVRYIIEIIGISLLLLPFLWTILDHSISWVWQAYSIGEASQNPTGLSHRWIIKSVIPLSFLLLMLAAIARLIQSVLLLRHQAEDQEPAISGRVSLVQHLFSVQVNNAEEDKAWK